MEVDNYFLGRKLSGAVTLKLVTHITIKKKRYYPKAY